MDIGKMSKVVLKQRERGGYSKDDLPRYTYPKDVKVSLFSCLICLKHA